MSTSGCEWVFPRMLRSKRCGRTESSASASATRYALLPLAVIGCWFAARQNWMITSLLFATIFYYLVPGTLAHTEIRYVLTLHWLLPIFAGLAVVTLGQFIRNRRAKGGSVV